MNTSCPWAGFQQPTLEFCEKALCEWVTEPSNAWSSWAFVIVGLIVYWKNWAEFQKPSPTTRRPLRIWMAPTMVAVGLGSFLFHATSTFWGEYLDVVSMDWYAALILLMNMRRTGFVSEKNQWLVYWGLVISACALLYFVPTTGVPVFLVLMGGAGIFEVLAWANKKTRAASYRDLRIALGIFFVAEIFWQLDFNKIVCNPHEHVIQFHGVWHVLDSISMYFMHKYWKQFQVYS